MELVEAVKRLKEHEVELKKLGVSRLYMFGSTVRGDQRPNSDVDLFFDYEGPMGLLRYMRIKEETSKILGCKADIMSRDSIDRFVRPRAEAEAVAVF